MSTPQAVEEYKGPTEGESDSDDDDDEKSVLVASVDKAHRSMTSIRIEQGCGFASRKSGCL